MDRSAPFEETAEELLEDAPCGYLSTDLDGTLLRVNRTFERLTGLSREALVRRRRFQDLLSPGGRIYHETHYAPLLHMQGAVREIAVDIVRADGTLMAALVNSVLVRDDTATPRSIRTVVFDATHRRRYEQELLKARRREHDIAAELQRSMLSGALPLAARLELGVLYRPAVAGLEVGGDWYDAFPLDRPDTIGLVVGDVVGRGIEAAATMGQLRSAVRALASTDLRPGRLLGALDAYAHRHEVGRMSTVVYAELCTRDGHVRYACAGHPPPLIVAAGAEPALALGGRSLPLDVDAGVPRTEGTAVLPEGSTLVLFTDGLVESRTRPLMVGLNELVAAARRVGDDAPAEIVERLADDLGVRTERTDDLCVLAARVG
ncbi:SpoIIE family protein phosphatase [Baekduia soli]|uniref:SpoIIE family protein phosphatase n=1 Tax=Baekduia soli TaxID=496014 RepID=A0A5B8U9F8_9ACTN|nr:SpoIIE family protein phosphatase [Baekduia soli]QEC49428.1 SpoIIE family protein phosphatase [Baekduia soli]